MTESHQKFLSLSEVMLDLPLAQRIERLVQTFAGKIIQLSSLSIEDQAITHMLLPYQDKLHFATIDTGRLPQESFDVIAETMSKYHCTFDTYVPERDDLETLLRQSGPNSFYDSLEARKACCHARKVIPLQRAINSQDVWITGLRQEHSPTRQALKQLEWDENHCMVKFNPIFDWSEAQVWAYIKEHAIPYSKLYDQGYTSIGCAPCTRATQSGESIRAGRWWWEQPEHKECGLHPNRPTAKKKTEV